ncbi:hypothetical protein [uncultured Sneathiella sp.]|uniref:hypothetical protein n=1 Tax=uncultured Sneathiella sp. TaxID=879315 RepID=UPI0030EEF6C9|tara:strand:+ start:13202 stop:13588 length:387 start_codon:yes stop_codon:yes gene_type:complete
MRMIAIAAFTLLMMTGTALADKWTGLYQNVDHLDGAIATLSVVKLEDGSYRIVVTTDAFNHCPDGGPGTVTATGRVEGDMLLRENVKYKCGDGPFQEGKDGAYKFDENGILSTTTHFGHTAYFHRVHP